MNATNDPNTEKSSILIIYTGGTIGMAEDPKTGSLEPFNFDHLADHVPELKSVEHSYSVIQFNPPLDSSKIGPADWVKMAKAVSDNYDKYDGFVILHGTDTMAYTASALSFMLENLSKPVIITGSQLPIGKFRTDGKTNLITAMEIAAAKKNNIAVVPEVCICFQDYLMRGNRCVKANADYFRAFESFNYPPIAHIGVEIEVDEENVLKPAPVKPFVAHLNMDPNVVVLSILPGITPEIMKGIFNLPNIKGVVMETFGVGNAPTFDWFIDILKEANARGIVIINVTQCMIGSVAMDIYDTGDAMIDAGVISGYDITMESAATKMMYLFGRGFTADQVKEYMKYSIAGEMTIHKTIEN
ncbi:MAG: type I asparaginase [Bacteroidales bacterium]